MEKIVITKLPIEGPDDQESRLADSLRYGALKQYKELVLQRVESVLAEMISNSGNGADSEIWDGVDTVIDEVRELLDSVQIASVRFSDVRTHDQGKRIIGNMSIDLEDNEQLEQLRELLETVLTGERYITYKTEISDFINDNPGISQDELQIKMGEIMNTK